jgi:nucleoside-diphosphate-sugar epimerase
MNKSVLVTGGSGILGKHLVPRLLKNGARVTILCRNPRPDIFPDNNALHWLQGDVAATKLGLATKDWNTLAGAIDTVFHLAARTDFKGNSLADYQDINIDGVANIHAFATAANSPLHHISTAFVCGRYQGVFCEEMLDQGQEFRNFYEQSKFLGEWYLRKKQQRKTSIPITIYRPSIILERNPTSDSGGNFGPFTFLDAIFRLLLAARKRQQNPEIIRVLGNQNSAMPFVFDDNVADTLFALAENPASHGKTFHLTTRNSFANREVETLFNQAFGKNVVCWATDEEIKKTPLCPTEELLARRTRVYADYLDLSLGFDRQQLDNALGCNALTDLSLNEVLDAFSRFLACKDDSNTPAPTHILAADNEITAYFTSYLPSFCDRPLLKNLANLNALFWLKIQDVGTWSIRIGEGCLRTVYQGTKGSFGYTVAPKTFLQVVRGQRSPQEGFFRGQITISGNTKEGLRTATALEEFFSQYPYLKGNTP